MREFPFPEPFFRMSRKSPQWYFRTVDLDHRVLYAPESSLCTTCPFLPLPWGQLPSRTYSSPNLLPKFISVGCRKPIDPSISVPACEGVHRVGALMCLENIPSPQHDIQNKEDGSTCRREHFWCGAYTVLLAISAAAQTNTFAASGNVGIGTTNPVSTLEVNGTAQVDNAKPRTKPATEEKE